MINGNIVRKLPVLILLLLGSVAHGFPNKVSQTVSVGGPPFTVIPGPPTYVSRTDGYVVSLKTGDYSIVKTVGLGSEARGMVLSSNLFVANYGSGLVSVLQTSDLTLKSGRPAVGRNPFGIVSASGQIFVTNEGDGTVSVIDAAQFTVSKTIQVGSKPQGIAANSSGTIYVVNSTDGTVSIIKSNAVSGTITIPDGAGAYGIALSPDGTKIFVTNPDKGKFYKIESESTVTGTYTVGGQPRGIAVLPNSTYIYIANYGNNEVDVISTSDFDIEKGRRIPVGGGPESVAITSDSATVFVANRGSGTISILYEKNPVVTIESVDHEFINNSTNDTARVVWNADENGTYQVEIGGTGTKGTGRQLFDQDQQVSPGDSKTFEIKASDLTEGDKAYPVFIYLTTSTGDSAVGRVDITLDTVPPVNPITDLIVAEVGDEKVNLTWSLNGDTSDVAGYHLYFSNSPDSATAVGAARYDYPGSPLKIDGGDRTDGLVSGLENEQEFRFSATAFDRALNESAVFSNEVAGTPHRVYGPGELLGEKGGCFVATAVFGRKSWQVAGLRRFRDSRLAGTVLGDLFIRAYYENGPAAARFVSISSLTRFIARMAVYPAVFIAVALEEPLPSSVLYLSGVGFIFLICLRGAGKRRKK
jgi:YVTN family beta-propeller protein